MIEAGQVRVVYKHLWLGNQRALWAAEAVECAGDQGKWQAYSSYLFKDQKQWTKGDLSKAAKTLGLDTNQFQQCLDSGKYTDAIKKSTAEGKAKGINSTPAIFLNGRQVDNATAFERIGQLAQEELKKK